MRSIAKTTTPLVLGSFLLACAPVNRTIVFDGYPQPDRDSAMPLSSRIVLEKPQIAVDSTCAADCVWSDGERRTGEVHFGADVVRLLGVQNATDVDPRARYIANVTVRLQEQHRRNGLMVLRIGLPLVMAVGSAVAAYQLTPRDTFTGGNNDKIWWAVTGFVTSWGLWSIVAMTIPSRTAHYRSEATVTIRDRATNQPVAQETISADFEDTFSDYGLPGKWDRASGTALRLLEPKVASLISLRMRALPQAIAIPPAPSFRLPQTPLPAAPTPAPAPPPVQPPPGTPLPAPAQPAAAGGGV
jgi:hypothetical protein